MTPDNISFAGAGRVAGALCIEFYRKGFKILKIVSETEKDGRSLADNCHAAWSSEPEFPYKSKLIVVAVPDHKLKEVLDKIQCGSNTLVAHTAGSFGLEVFPDRLKKTGVFYPLQTFSKGRNIVFRDLPFFIEASDKNSSDILRKLAETIGGKVYLADTEHRRMLHVAAVFVCNFINHMLMAGNEIAGRAGFSPEVLNPLINETISKALDVGPVQAQTGPALRNDLNTIKKHMELLSFSPELQKIYSDITQSIINHYKRESANG